MTREEAEQYLYYAMTIGEQLLCCGAEVGRVEDTIRRICLAYGATRADVFSITSSIVTTIYGEDFGICTQTRRVPGMSNDLGRLDDLNQLSRYICEYRPKPEEIQKGLEKIRDKQGYSDFALCCNFRFFFRVFRRRCQRYDCFCADWYRPEAV